MSEETTRPAGTAAGAPEGQLTEPVLHAYAALWSEPDPRRRGELMRRSLTDDAEIVGPGYRFRGYTEISAEVERFLRHDPDAHPVLASGFDAHHGLARFAVAMVDETGSVVSRGEDIVEVAADGRIRRVLTFWGDLPPVPAEWPTHLVLP